MSQFKTTLPKCQDCGAGRPNVVGIEETLAVTETPAGRSKSTYIRHVWLCPDCEYKLSHPNAVEGIEQPRQRPPVPLQRETLFDL
jgi:hypothetical protein